MCFAYLFENANFCFKTKYIMNEDFFNIHFHNLFNQKQIYKKYRYKMCKYIFPKLI